MEKPVHAHVGLSPHHIPLDPHDGWFQPALKCPLGSLPFLVRCKSKRCFGTPIFYWLSCINPPCLDKLIRVGVEVRSGCHKHTKRTGNVCKPWETKPVGNASTLGSKKGAYCSRGPFPVRRSKQRFQATVFLTLALRVPLLGQVKLDLRCWCSCPEGS